MPLATAPPPVPPPPQPPAGFLPATGPIRVVCLGDSITVGIGDPMPDGRWRGWAPLLAAALAEPGRVTLRNVATSGAMVADVAGPQLRAALSVRPHLASVVIGINDTLRDTFDIAAIGARLTATVAALTADETRVLTARLPEPGRMLGLPASLARPLTRRVRAVNAIIDGVAGRFGTVHVDLGSLPGAYDRRMWSVDRLHPSERGHRLLARCFAEALIARGYRPARLPGLEPVNPEPTRRAKAWWMATRGTRWVLGRGTDLLPYLIGMAAAESWYRLRGAATRFDDRLRRDVVETLSRLEDRAHAENRTNLEELVVVG